MGYLVRCLAVCGVGAAILLLISPRATAEVVARCGGSNGYAYFLAGAFVEPSQSGFTDDQISQGEIQLVANGDQIDIFITDALGTKSTRAEGAQIINLGNGGNPGFISVLVVYVPEGIVESYLFRLGDAGKGEVVWTQSKLGPIQKGAVYRAACIEP